MNKWLITALCLVASAPSYSATCKPIKHKSGEIITVNSAPLLGGRIQLPSNLVAPPLVSNSHLWDVDGLKGSNQIFLKPNSQSAEGKNTMIFATTEDGKVYDIMVNRVTAKQNQACVIVSTGSPIFNDQQQRELSQFMTARLPSATQHDQREIQRLQKELSTTQAQSNDRVKKAVVEALQKYQYRIYTRYEWNEGVDFVGRDTISDVYDDGQFTYLRLSNPNRGILSVETVIGGKRAIAPTRYIDSYGMYKVTGIYPRFTLRIDDVTIEVNRRDNRTKGNT
ncbi:TrbG/VirB9 family P-type conjugative transfer protein (plasmid) [Vibrio alfacsensis]|uniref:TrbG/VirB9 family P-type conjugative transfer protein n=1 Tax=Vibrio alfacsensis TaxID=1074311 RepID=UPI002ADE549D|nr:TrbG/VirB9 family P-type conjugative transfer protein [Vibrio alfacsensis]WQE79447.1 TrbG/VirB9 family P-type conjugative transfer protein [Vibrio alfacsensis]